MTIKTAILTLFATSVFAGGALAEYPEKRIDLIVPWTAGGSTDARARVLAPKFEEILGQTVVVRNVAGAAGTIGTNEVASARADGYTLLLTPAGPTVIQPRLRELPYTLEDFDLVCRLDSVPIVWMVEENSDYKTMQDFVDAAKARPGELSYATAGVGTIPHLVGLRVASGFGIDLKHLPAKGAADAMKNLLGDIVDAAPESEDHVARFDVRALGIASEERSEVLPDVPTFRELGVDLVQSHWQAIYMPKGAPEEVRGKLASACNAALTDPAVIESFENMNTKADPLTGEALTEFVAGEDAALAELLKHTEIK
ncbi:tripartite tricarboxylate transporter substrate binding protein [Defluviimonas sp. SAOS-178_SWC]|uniref:tripartite tricarboxylate transporter substrate binding protein n=1 Tax=Defluviimonas sp. SAOS-178_SWC TaxID=3121287 RepID=UPI003221B4DB